MSCWGKGPCSGLTVAPSEVKASFCFIGTGRLLGFPYTCILILARQCVNVCLCVRLYGSKNLYVCESHELQISSIKWIVYIVEKVYSGMGYSGELSLQSCFNEHMIGRRWKGPDRIGAATVVQWTSNLPTTVHLLSSGCTAWGECPSRRWDPNSALWLLCLIWSTPTKDLFSSLPIIWFLTNQAIPCQSSVKAKII